MQMKKFMKFLLIIKIKKLSNVGDQLLNFEILTTIDKGIYDFAVKVNSKKDHKIYAIKTIEFNKLKAEDEKKLSLNEIKLIQGLNNPHIIKYNQLFLYQKIYIIIKL